MEGHQPDQALQIAMMPGGSGALGASRWNPTKEQIDMLEDVYKQGIRTPNAEQINDITSRLREYGHIEGKNVFYWFQNHKARQRQKQKQSKKDTISYSNRFILPKPPVSSAAYHQPPHFPAGVCMPYRAEMGLYNQQQQPRLLLPRPVKRRPPPLFPAPVAGGPPGRFLPPYSGQANYYYNNGLIFSPGRGIEENKETLELFPVQPSGDLLSPNSASSNFLAGGKRQIQGIPAAGDGGGDRAFFDFMCGSNIASSSRDRY